MSDKQLPGQRPASTIDSMLNVAALYLPDTDMPAGLEVRAMARLDRTRRRTRMVHAVAAIGGLVAACWLVPPALIRSGRLAGKAQPDAVSVERAGGDIARRRASGTDAVAATAPHGGSDGLRTNVPSRKLFARSAGRASSANTGPRDSRALRDSRPQLRLRSRRAGRVLQLARLAAGQAISGSRDARHATAERKSTPRAPERRTQTVWRTETEETDTTGYVALTWAAVTPNASRQVTLIPVALAIPVRMTTSRDAHSCETAQYPGAPSVNDARTAQHSDSDLGADR
jgi:hypothetical protein